MILLKVGLLVQCLIQTFLVKAQMDMEASDNMDKVLILSISTNPDQENKDRVSSYEGGTMLYIKGTGFDTEMASNNVVMVGELTCNIEGTRPFLL